MNYFSEQGLSYSEVIERLKTRYGENIRILSHKTVMVGGFLGLFKKEGVQIDGYVSQDPFQKKNPKLEEEKEKLIQTAKGTNTLSEVLKTVNAIKIRLDEGTSQQEGTHETINRVEKILMKNDFSFSFVNMITEKIKKNISLDDLDNFNFVLKKVRDWIRELIFIYPEKNPLTTPRIFILVGPTGVGKTTTIAKLAAINALGIQTKPLSVRIITIDNYRIGARKQIETYGEIMSVPVVSAENFDQLRKYIALYSEDVDLVLIDTIGKSPHDYKKLAEMKELLDACGTTSEFHLAVSAITKVSDIFEIMQQFESFKYSSIVVTKLDETCHAGNIISALYETRKPVSYITTGQNVPYDIKYATEELFLEHLGEFNTVK
ncbi:MAG: flagellar biosynthesis protein FlhF [Spirochaetia bacterium]|jgi:flagellar biosynthesis protein FlhF|nr:flagellar biosynthesis protein FlhF [Spirochaetia bacterium]